MKGKLGVEGRQKVRQVCNMSTFLILKAYQSSLKPNLIIFMIIIHMTSFNNSNMKLLSNTNVISNLVSGEKHWQGEILLSHMRL